MFLEERKKLENPVTNNTPTNKDIKNTGARMHVMPTEQHIDPL